MTPTERLLDAARREVNARERLASISKLVEPCDYADAGEPAVGDMGNPACRYDDEATPEEIAGWCQPCREYQARRAAFRAAKVDQRKARADMLRAYRAEIEVRAT